MSRPPPFTLCHYPLPGGELRPIGGDGEARSIAARLVGLTPWRDLGYSSEALASYLVRPDAGLHRFGIGVDGATAGVFCIRYPWLRGPYIELIAIFPGHQDRGLGGQLVAWLAGEVPGSANLWALVSAFNREARAFYAQHGFSEIAPLPDLVKPGCDEILLRYAIGKCM